MPLWEWGKGRAIKGEKNFLKLFKVSTAMKLRGTAIKKKNFFVWLPLEWTVLKTLKLLRFELMKKTEKNREREKQSKVKSNWDIWVD